MSTADVSIVIPFRGNPQGLRYSLDSLRQQTARLNDIAELIIVNDGGGSLGHTAISQAASQLDPLIVDLHPGVGRSGARNAGVEHAHAPLLLFIDADAYCDSTLVAVHLEGQRRETAPVIFGRRFEVLWPTFGEVVRTASRYDWAKLSGVEADNRSAALDYGLFGGGWQSAPWLFLFGHNFSLSRDIFSQAGGFDDSLRGWGWEDIEFGYRLFHWLGQTPEAFAYEPEAVCFHVPHFRNHDTEDAEGDVNLQAIKRKHQRYDMELLETAYRQTAATFIGMLNRAFHAFRVKGSSSWSGALQSLTSERSLVIGCFGDNLPAQVPFTVFDHGRPEAANNRHLIGVDLPMSSDTFDRVVNVDLWRAYPWPCLDAFLSESLRVSDEALLVYTRTLESDEELALIDDPLFLMEALSTPFSVSTVDLDPNTTLFRVSPRAQNAKEPA